MKRGRKLLLLLAVLIALAGGTMLVKNRTTQVVELEEEPEATVLLQLEEDALTGLRWTRDDETLTLSWEGDTWSFPEDPDFPLSTAKADSLASALKEVLAVKTIEEPDSLSAYGLEEPAVVITVTANREAAASGTTDGGATVSGTTELRIGTGESQDGYRYASLGDGKVYLVDKGLAEAFSCGLYDLVRKESLPSMSNPVSLTVTSDVQDYEIDHLEGSGIAYTDQYEWFLKDGDGWLALDTDEAEIFLDQVRILAWQECVNYHADDAALAAYGLDHPSVTAALRYLETREVETDILAEDGLPVYDTVTEEKSFVLEIGGYAASGCYARIAGSPMVYTISSSVCDSLLYMHYDDLRPRDVFLTDTNLLTEVEVTLDGQTSVFQKSIKTVSGEDGEASSETIWLLNGEETAFAEVLYDLDYMLSEDFADDVIPQRQAELRFLFQKESATHPETELVFYAFDSSRCLVTVDGMSTVFLDRYSVTGLMEQIRGMYKLPSGNT